MKVKGARWEMIEWLPGPSLLRTSKTMPSPPGLSVVCSEEKSHRRCKDSRSSGWILSRTDEPCRGAKFDLLVPSPGTITQVFDFGIAGYRPAWLTGRSAIVAAHGRRLAMLKGRRLTQTFLVWDLEADAWFSDGLALLAFEGEQVEIVHQKFDELSITWNTVDPTQPLDWAGQGLRLAWRQGVPGELAALIGQRLQAVELLEWTSEDAALGMVAVSFTFPDGQVTIYNALDENGMEFGPPDRRYTRHRIDHH